MSALIFKSCFRNSNRSVLDRFDFWKEGSLAERPRSRRKGYRNIETLCATVFSWEMWDASAEYVNFMYVFLRNFKWDTVLSDSNRSWASWIKSREQLSLLTQSANRCRTKVISGAWRTYSRPSPLKTWLWMHDPGLKNIAHAWSKCRVQGNRVLRPPGLSSKAAKNTSICTIQKCGCIFSYQ